MGIRHYVTNNLGLKVLSLAIAVTLWYAVGRQPVAEIVLSVPIEFHNGPEDLEIGSERIPQAQVRVRGPVTTLRQLSASEIHPVVDLRNAQPGERTYDLSAAATSVPQNLEVVQVIPGQFRISLDGRAVRQVEVHPRVTGTFATGYRITSMTANPAMVTVAGPARRVKEVDAVITDPVDATGVVGQAVFTTRPYVSDPMVRIVSPAAVRVTVVTERLP